MAIAIEWQRLVFWHGIRMEVEMPPLPLFIAGVILEPDRCVFVIARADGIRSYGRW
jgi:hypothetical protein